MGKQTPLGRGLEVRGGREGGGIIEGWKRKEGWGGEGVMGSEKDGWKGKAVGSEGRREGSK